MILVHEFNKKIKNHLIVFANFCSITDPGTSEMETFLLTKAIGSNALSYLSDFSIVNESKITLKFL